MFISEKSDVQSKSVGHGTSIWQYCVVLSGAVIGENCNICAQVLIENDVVIGDRVTVKSGVQLWDGVTIEDDVFIGPNVTFTNDRFPRSKQHPSVYDKTLIEKNASIGANATIIGGIKIARNAMIGAGAVVTKDVPPNAIVVGNPARISGYVNSRNETKSEVIQLSECDKAFEASKVKGVGLYNLPIIKDLRGSLSFAEVDQYLPFTPQRYFLVYDVKSNEIRGEHAHRNIEQFLICVKGSLSVLVDDGFNRKEYELNSPGRAIHIPSMIWGVQYKYSEDATLLVLASGKYDASEYIRDYDEFLNLAGV